MQASESSPNLSSLDLSDGENFPWFEIYLINKCFYFSSQSKVSNDPKQQAKNKTKNSIPLPRKDYDWLDTNK